MTFGFEHDRLTSGQLGQHEMLLIFNSNQSTILHNYLSLFSVGILFTPDPIELYGPY